MIPRLADCRGLNINFLLFYPTCRTFYPAQTAVASLRAPSPFDSRLHGSGLHHNSRISDASAKGVCGKQGHHRRAHTAVGHESALQPLGVDEVLSDYASLDGVPPGESLQRAESCQNTGTLDTNPNCGLAAYSEVVVPHNRSLGASDRIPLELVRLARP